MTAQIPVPLQEELIEQLESLQSCLDELAAAEAEQRVGLILDLLAGLGWLRRRTRALAAEPRAMAAAAQVSAALAATAMSAHVEQALLRCRPAGLSRTMNRLAEASAEDPIDIEALGAAAEAVVQGRERLASILRAAQDLFPALPELTLRRIQTEMREIDRRGAELSPLLVAANAFRRAQRAWLDDQDETAASWWWSTRTECPLDLLRLPDASEALHAHADGCPACRRDLSRAAALAALPAGAQHPLAEIERVALDPKSPLGAELKEHLSSCTSCRVLYEEMVACARPGVPRRARGSLAAVGVLLAAAASLLLFIGQRSPSGVDEPGPVARKGGDPSLHLRLRRGGETIRPGGSDVLLEGDALVLLASPVEPSYLTVLLRAGDEPALIAIHNHRILPRPDGPIEQVVRPGQIPGTAPVRLLAILSRAPVSPQALERALAGPSHDAGAGQDAERIRAGADLSVSWLFKRGKPP